jgi:histidinol-phosphate aminotransferase
MRMLSTAFDRLGLPFVPSAANFVLVRVGQGLTVYQRLLQRGVIVRPMDGYSLPEYLRVTIGLPEENRRFVEALESVLREGG